MKIYKKRQQRQIQVYQKIKQIIDKFTDTTAAICIFKAINENVTTTQLNQIFISLENEKENEKWDATFTY